MSRFLGLCVLGAAALGCTTPDPGLLPSERSADSAFPHAASEGANPCASALDFDGDGAIDERFTYSYDARGRSTRDTGKYTDGSPAEITDYEWDNLDHLVHARTHEAYVFDWTALYDTLGQLSQIDILSIQTDGTMTTRRTEYPEHDAAGSPTRSLVFHDGAVFAAYHYTYDEHDRLVTRARDLGNDGTIDDTQVVTYDEHARTVTAVITTAAGQRTDLRVTTYNDANRVVATHEEAMDQDDPSVTDIYDDHLTWSGDRLVEETQRETAASFSSLLRQTFQFDCH